MWCPRFAAVAVCFVLTVVLTIPDDGLAQGVPGYRMRVPTGVSLLPPRLTATTPSILDRAGGRFGRHFVVPNQYFAWYSVGSSDYAYPDDSTDYSTETEPARDIYPIDDSVQAVGRLQVSFEPIVSRTVVRLTWRDHGVGATQVAFFLADTGRAILSAQTVRSPPFTALFEPPPGTAFAGMTVVLPGGTLVTQFLPYRRREH